MPSNDHVGSQLQGREGRENVVAIMKSESESLSESTELSSFSLVRGEEKCIVIRLVRLIRLIRLVLVLK
jgi:hypothetical protein